MMVMILLLSAQRGMYTYLKQALQARGSDGARSIICAVIVNMLGRMYTDFFLIRKWDFRSVKYCLLVSGFLEQIKVTALS